MPLFSWISVRHLVRSPLRSLLVVFGIALGVAMFVATSAVNTSIRGAFLETVERVTGKTDLVITGGGVGVPAELIDELARVEGVAHIAGLIETTTQIAGPKGGAPLLILGVDFLGDRWFLPFTAAEGDDPLEDPLELINDPRAVLISRRLALQDNLHSGGTLALLTPDGPQDFHIRGILADEGPAASYGGQVAVMFIEAARASFARGEHVDRIDLALAPGSDPSAVKARINAVLGDRGIADEPSGRARHLAGILGPFEAGIQVAGFVALAVGMFIIYNAVSIAVAQRRREIGILRALGTRRRSIVRMFAVEAIALAAIGSAAGLLLARLIAEIALAQAAPAVDQFYMPIMPQPPRIGLELAAAGIALGLLLTLAAAYLPARRASEVDPIDAMRAARDRPLHERVRHRGLLFAGLLLTAPAFAFARAGTMWTGFAAMGLMIAASVLAVPAFVLRLGVLARGIAERILGVPGRVALDNAVRSLERSALTVAALTVSVAASVCVGSWGRSLEVSLLEWVDETIPADLTATAGSPLPGEHNMPFRAEALEALRGIPGVRAILPVRIVSHDFGGLRFMLVSQPTRAYFDALASKKLSLRVIEGEQPIRAEELEETPSFLLSENAAMRLGVHPGDTVTLPTPAGARPMRVRAVIVDYTSTLGMAYLDRKWFTEYFGDTLADTADIYVDPGVELERVEAEARKRLGGVESIFISSSADVRREIRRVILETIAVTRSTDLVAIIVALLGVVGTMLAAVIDRLRELGLLRAIGATRRQIVAAIVAESGFLGLASVLLGVLASVPMGAIFVHVVALSATGWRLDYHFPAAVALQVGVSVALTAAIAGLLPGRIAAQLSIKDALSYE